MSFAFVDEVMFIKEALKMVIHHSFKAFANVGENRSIVSTAGFFILFEDGTNQGSF